MSEPLRNETRRAITVAIYTPWSIATGDLYPGEAARLSDVLNNLEDDFLSLESACITDLGHPQVESMPGKRVLLISRQEILLAHEVSAPATQPARPGAAEMRVQKQMLPVRARVGPFRVEGLLSATQYSTILSYLNRSAEAFVVLTNAVISPPEREELGEVRVAFALVSRKSLVMSGE